MSKQPNDEIWPGDATSRPLKRFTAILFALLVFACSTHSIFASNIVATWTGNNPANTVDYVLQRQVGTNWVDLAPTTKAETVTIPNVAPGVYVLRVVARVGTLESAPSNTVTVNVGPNAPTVLSVTLS